MGTKKGSVAGSKGVKKSVPETTLPNWPAFKPLLPIEDLGLKTVVDSQIVVIKQFWTSTLCKNYVSFLKTLPLVTTPGVPKRGEALRVNDRYEVHDPAFANRLWVESGLRELISGHEDDMLNAKEDGLSKGEREQLWQVDIT